MHFGHVSTAEQAGRTRGFAPVAERLRRGGDPQQAVAVCTKGLARFPDHLSGRVTLGWALLDLGRYEEARRELEQVLRRAPDNLAAIRGLAELHEREESSLYGGFGEAGWMQEDAAPAVDPAAFDAAAAAPVIEEPPDDVEADTGVSASALLAVEAVGELLATPPLQPLTDAPQAINGRASAYASYVIDEYLPAAGQPARPALSADDYAPVPTFDEPPSRLEADSAAAAFVETELADSDAPGADAPGAIPDLGGLEAYAGPGEGDLAEPIVLPAAHDAGAQADRQDDDVPSVVAALQWASDDVAALAFEPTGTAEFDTIGVGDSIPETPVADALPPSADLETALYDHAAVEFVAEPDVEFAGYSVEASVAQTISEEVEAEPAELTPAFAEGVPAAVAFAEATSVGEMAEPVAEPDAAPSGFDSAVPDGHFEAAAEFAHLMSELGTADPAPVDLPAPVVVDLPPLEEATDGARGLPALDVEASEPVTGEDAGWHRAAAAFAAVDESLNAAASDWVERLEVMAIEASGLPGEPDLQPAESEPAMEAALPDQHPAFSGSAAGVVPFEPPHGLAPVHGPGADLDDVPDFAGFLSDEPVADFHPPTCQEAVVDVSATDAHVDFTLPRAAEFHPPVSAERATVSDEEPAALAFAFAEVDRIAGDETGADHPALAALHFTHEADEPVAPLTPSPAHLDAALWPSAHAFEADWVSPPELPAIDPDACPVAEAMTEAHDAAPAAFDVVPVVDTDSAFALLDQSAFVLPFDRHAVMGDADGRPGDSSDEDVTTVFAPGPERSSLVALDRMLRRVQARRLALRDSVA